jgi:hypothetical protein
MSLQVKKTKPYDAASFQDEAPNWEAFKQSDEYAKSATQMGSAVIAPLDVGGTTYNFSNPVIADAYKAYMSRMGVDVKSGGSQSVGQLTNPVKSEIGMGASLLDPRDYFRKTANTEDVLNPNTKRQSKAQKNDVQRVLWDEWFYREKWAMKALQNLTSIQDTGIRAIW